MELLLLLDTLENRLIQIVAEKDTLFVESRLPFSLFISDLFVLQELQSTTLEVSDLTVARG